MRKPSADRGSVQSARKALVLLKQIAAHHVEGVRLTDLVALSAFDKSTVHRLVGTLAAEGFVERVPSTKRYRLGLEAVQMGLAAPDMAPLLERFRPVLYKIARQSEDTVFLVVRSGDEAVCVHRQEGSYPVKAFVTDAGKRRLLGFSAVGICLLAGDSDVTIAAQHARHAEAYDNHGITLAVLREHVHFARRHGHSEMQGYGPPDTAGVGYAFQMSATAKAGVSIAAIGARMGPRRMRELGQLLQQELAPFAYVPPAAAASCAMALSQ